MAITRSYVCAWLRDAYFWKQFHLAVRTKLHEGYGRDTLAAGTHYINTPGNANQEPKTVSLSFLALSHSFVYPCQEQPHSLPTSISSLLSKMRFAFALAAIPALVAAAPAGKRCTGTISSLEDVAAAVKCTTVSRLC